MKLTPKHYGTALYQSTDGLTGEKLDRALDGFVQLLASRGLLGKIDRIIAAYRQAADRAAGVVAASVQSARPLDDKSLAHLTTKLEHLTGKHVRLEQQTKPELMGGVRIRFEDAVLDASLTGSLTRLRAHLSSPQTLS